MQRRQFLAASGGLTAALLLPFIALAEEAKDNGAAKLIADFIGDGKVDASGLKLTMPEIAENGNTVPLTVEVDSPMTEENYVKEILVVAQSNPSPEVARFSFTPLAGVAKADTRMRLAQTQDVVALARMSNGSIAQARQTVKVTIGGCGG